MPQSNFRLRRDNGNKCMRAASLANVANSVEKELLLLESFNFLFLGFTAGLQHFTAGLMVFQKKPFASPVKYYIYVICKFALFRAPIASFISINCIYTAVALCFIIKSLSV